MSVMGSKIDNFSIPICNSFKSTILNDQVCYELDAERFVDKENIHKDLRLGKFAKYTRSLFYFLRINFNIGL